MSAGFQNDFSGRTQDGLDWVLLDYLVYEARSGRQLRVIIGATTDGPSVPQLLWSLKNPTGKPWLCGVLHDGGYKDCLEMLSHDGTWHHISLSKDMCDDLFKEALQVHGVGAEDTFIFYEAVHLFGATAFVADRSKSPPEAFHEVVAPVQVLPQAVPISGT